MIAGWRVADFTGAVDGSCVLTLRNARGRAQRVHLCRNTGQPEGLAYTKYFDLMVMNGGDGELPTEEGFAHAVAQISRVIKTRERENRSTRNSRPRCFHTVNGCSSSPVLRIAVCGNDVSKRRGSGIPPRL